MFFSRTRIEAEICGQTTEVRALSYGVLRLLKATLQPLIPALATIQSQARTGKSKVTTHRDEKLIPPVAQISPDGTEVPAPANAPKILHRQLSEIIENDGESIEQIQFKETRKTKAIEMLLDALLGDTNSKLLVQILVDSFPGIFRGHSWKNVTQELIDETLADLDVGTLSQMFHAMWKANQESLAPLGKLLAGSGGDAKESETAPAQDESTPA